MLIFTLFVLPLSIFADDLVQVQVITRHGDRTPLLCYPTDPYLQYWSQWLPGELTTIGMSQHFQQGLRLKERYIEQMGFISENYKRHEIFVQSSYKPRCIQSAASNLAGFYSGSKNTHPDDQGWPSQWTPVPIHPRTELKSHQLDVGDNCPRNDELMAERAKNKEFVEYQAAHVPLFRKIEENAGLKTLQLFDLFHFYDCTRIEKVYRNWSLPSWVTRENWLELTDFYEETGDYLYGEAGFGVENDFELLKLRGGPLLTELVNNMESAQNNASDYMMYVNVAHDTTISSLLRVLGAKYNLLGHKNPDYGAALAFELWKGSNGYYVKMLYSANENSSFRPITHLVRGCEGGDNCPYSIFYGTSRPYLVEHPAELCEKVL